MKTKKLDLQKMLGIHDNSHPGDIARLNDDDELVTYAIRKRYIVKDNPVLFLLGHLGVTYAIRNRYIVKAGDRYVLTNKVLWRRRK